MPQACSRSRRARSALHTCVCRHAGKLRCASRLGTAAGTIAEWRSAAGAARGPAASAAGHAQRPSCHAAAAAAGCAAVDGVGNASGSAAAGASGRAGGSSASATAGCTCRAAGGPSAALGQQRLGHACQRGRASGVAVCGAAPQRRSGRGRGSQCQVTARPPAAATRPRAPRSARGAAAGRCTAATPARCAADGAAGVGCTGAGRGPETSIAKRLGPTRDGRIAVCAVAASGGTA